MGSTLGSPFGQLHYSETCPRKLEADLSVICGAIKGAFQEEARSKEGLLCRMPDHSSIHACKHNNARQLPSLQRKRAKSSSLSWTPCKALVPGHFTNTRRLKLRFITRRQPMLDISHRETILQHCATPSRQGANRTSSLLSAQQAARLKHMHRDESSERATSPHRT